MSQESRLTLGELSGSGSLLDSSPDVDCGCSVTGEGLPPKLTSRVVGRSQFHEGFWTEDLSSL